MASTPPQPPPGRVVEQLSSPQHFTPPSPRELRSQAVHRLQAGLFGIAAVVLVVLLANIINERARRVDGDAAGKVAAVPSAPATKTDPLADIGVVPQTAPEAGASQAAAPNATGDAPVSH